MTAFDYHHLYIGGQWRDPATAGTIGVNQYVNDPAAPFGGIKASGIGRELGPEGLHAFQVHKTIYMPPA
jgi:acyl-CoA reductase-like NAD-dependent aldehyde dehydrogenase